MTSSGTRALWRGHPMTCFLVLTAALSWWPWPLYAAGLAPLPVASFGPFLAALVVVGLTSGRAGVVRWLRSLAQWPVAARWWLVAVAVPVIASVVATAVHLMAVPSGLDPGALAGWTSIPLSFLAALVIPGFGGAWEEPGWRGWALPQLAQRYGVTTASLVLGVVGALWHLPLILEGLDSWWDLLLLVAANVVLARLFFAAGGSIWPVMVLHATNNAFSGGFISPLFRGAEASRQSALLAGAWCLMAVVVIGWSRLHAGTGSSAPPARRPAPASRRP
jgi:membrane protease YdiL (CAAX protease family)